MPEPRAEACVIVAMSVFPLFEFLNISRSRIDREPIVNVILARRQMSVSHWSYS
jgi:hypothetical protein